MRIKTFLSKLFEPLTGRTVTDNKSYSFPTYFLHISYLAINLENRWRRWFADTKQIASSELGKGKTGCEMDRQICALTVCRAVIKTAFPSMFQFCEFRIGTERMQLSDTNS